MYPRLDITINNMLETMCYASSEDYKKDYVCQDYAEFENENFAEKADKKAESTELTGFHLKILNTSSECVARNFCFFFLKVRGL